METSANKSRVSLSTILSGVAGEYYVAAELSKMGHIASITLRNTKGVDILCSNGDATRSVLIQVKTNQGAKREWMLTAKSEKFTSASLFYVFVCLNDGMEPPDYYIVPSSAVAKSISSSHLKWLRIPGKNGRKHVDNKIRKFRDKEESYRKKWDVLGL